MKAIDLWIGGRDCTNTLLLPMYPCRFRASVPLDHLEQELAFPNRADLLAFIEPFELKFVDVEKKSLDCKASMSALPL